MKKEEIHLGDIKRILFGDAPPAFLVEVALRTLLIYLALLVVARLMGKRMSGQLTISEFAVMLTLGAIVAPSMQVPDKGLAAGIIILLCVLFFQRGLSLLEFKSDKVEQTTQGKASLLIKDGVLQTDEIKKAGLTRQQVLARLRNKHILNVAKVKRMYLETCGIFSIYHDSMLQKAGLSVVPAKDTELAEGQIKASGLMHACTSCGNIVEGLKADKPCNHCGANDWTYAVL